ncbi:MAG: hypothetical protein EPO40_08365 [Myxococcaceae bacterium]|nr:MAG: hypothetical protein EPO40_08365 [Myxococcaceae bacterium]
MIAEYELIRNDDAIPEARLRRLGDVMQAIAERHRWTRWVYLERSLELASLAGDLLCAATTLRTMLDEVSRLRALDEVHTRIDRGVGRRADLRRWCNLLRDFHVPHALTTKAKEPSRSGVIEAAYKSLNDYVHPNYGSHLAALFPERAIAGRVILEAAIAVYREFFLLSWSGLEPSPPHERLPPIEHRNVESDSLQVRSVVKPAVDRHLIARYGIDPPKWPPALGRVLSGVRLASELAPSVAESAVPGLFDGLGPLLDAVDAGAFEGTHGERIEHLEAWSHALSLPRSASSWQALATARRLSATLELLAGRIDQGAEPADRLRHTLYAASLALVTAGIKHDMFERAVIREVADSNPLAAMIPARSLLESHAIIATLGDQVRTAWTDFEAKAGAQGVGSVDLDDVDRPIAGFLAGTKGTAETATGWRTRWKALDLTTAVALQASVDKTFGAEPGAQRMYDFFSMVMHGTRCKGVELCAGDYRAYRSHNLYRALLIVGELASGERAMDRNASAATVAAKIDWLAGQLGDYATPDEIRTFIRGAVSRARMDYGIHYSGSGTHDDPFKVSSSLFYHEAFRRLCEQLGFGEYQRTLVGGGSGTLFDRVQHAAGVAWFAVPAVSHRTGTDGPAGVATHEEGPDP